MAQVEIEIVGKDSFSGVLGNFGNIMTGIKSAIDLAADAFRAFAGFASQGLDAVAEYERLGLVLETLVAKEMLMSGEALNMAHALNMSGDEAQELIVWIEQLAIKSPFTSEGVARAFQMAMAYGFTTDEAQRLTQALIDFAAGSGASEESMSRIALALGQIEAKGKLSGQEILQLVNAGLPVIQILADAFDKTTAEVTQMVTDGLVPADKAIQAITEYLENNFAGAAERQSLSWAGLLATFQDISRIGLREFFIGMFEALQPVAVALADFLQTEGMDKIREWGGYLGIFTQALVDLLSGNKLYDLGASLQGIAGTDSTFYALGTAIRVFQQAVDDGLPTISAFKLGMDKFMQLDTSIDDTLLGKIGAFALAVVSAIADWNTSDATTIEKFDNFVSRIFDAINNSLVLWNAGGGPADLVKAVVGFIDDIGTGPTMDSKSSVAAGNILAALDEAIANSQWEKIVITIDEKLAEKIEQADWEGSGNSMSNAFDRIFAADGSWSEPMSDKWAWVDNLPFVMAFRFIGAIVTSDTVQELATGISNWFKGAFDIDTTQWGWLDSFPFLMTARVIRGIVNSPLAQQIGQAWSDLFRGGFDPNTEKWSWLDNIPFIIAARFIRALWNSGPIEWLRTQIGNVFMNVFDPYGDQWTWLDTWGDTFLRLLWPPAMVTYLYNKFYEMAPDSVKGFLDGLASFGEDMRTWVDTHIIAPVKRALGIASPSTVFMEIGKDIVNGIILGIGSMLGFLLTFANTFAGSFVNKVVEKFGDLRDRLSTIFTEIKAAWDDNGIAGVLSYLQDKISGIGDTTTGTVGGMEGDTSHDPRSGGTTSTTLTGTTTNTFNFYGTVYMSGVGPEGTFDCPSPHPIMIASSQSLLTSGVA